MDDLRTKKIEPPMTNVTVQNNRPSLLHPGVLLATWFGAGYLPKGPGTWGSLGALPFAWVLMQTGGAGALCGAIIVVFCVGLWASKDFMDRTDSHDPGAIVIDEVAGQWIVLLVTPLDPLSYAIGFALFRLFDIFKPWPISWADKSLKGAWGVMVDDVLAGVFGVVAMLLIARYFIPSLGGGL